MKFKPTKLFVFIFIVIVVGCKKDKFDVDVSDIDLKIDIKRLEKDIFTINPDSVSEKIPYLEKKYGRFFDLYNERIIQIGGTNNKAYISYLRMFITDYQMRKTYEKIMEVYPDLTELESELTEAFKHYSYYFPEDTIPEIYTCNSGYNYAISTDKNMIGIGLDMYLGADCDFYPRLGIDRYKQVKMHPEKILSDCMYAWGMTEFPYNDSIDNVLSNMIYKGKLMYFVYAMLPDEADTLKFGYSKRQWSWAVQYEEKMWEHIIGEKILFSTDHLDINRLVKDGPFTTLFANNSAPRAGVFIGWRIVQAFMKNNPGITLPELMAIDNYQYIMDNSKYSP